MSEQAALDKKAIRKEILALIIPIILESIFVYLAGIVSASLVGHLSGLAVATQGLANRITGLLNVVWGAVRIGSMVYYVNLIGEGKYGELKQGFKNICTVTLGIASLPFYYYHIPVPIPDPVILYRGCGADRVGKKLSAYYAAGSAAVGYDQDELRDV